MTGNKDAGVQWRHTSVAIRADIFQKAHEHRLNISEECNRVLANILGIDYRQQQLAEEVIPQPVIIAAEPAASDKKKVHNKPPSSAVPPVINADDPTTPVKVMRSKRRTAIKKAPVLPQTEPVPSPEPDAPPVPSAPRAPHKGKERKSVAEKKTKESIVKKFIAAKIVRVDADDAVVTKDEMYQAFIRWCREHRCVQIPDKKKFGVALKNQFVITEKAVDGTPCWVNIHLK